MSTILELYYNSINDLLRTEHFFITPIEESFEISDNPDNNCIDVNALIATLTNIGDFLCEPLSRQYICNAIIDTNMIQLLIRIPERTFRWHIDKQLLASTLIKTLTLLSRTSKNINVLLAQMDNTTILFDGLKMFGKPSQRLITECLNLAFDSEAMIIVNGLVVISLINWIHEMDEGEQVFLSEQLIKICGANLSW